MLKNNFLNFLAIFIIFKPLLAVNASLPDWISVPKSKYREQLWDKNSIKKNQDGSIRVFSKFISKSPTEITQDVLYKMDINCVDKSFRDVAVGSKEFNEFKNNY